MMWNQKLTLAVTAVASAAAGAGVATLVSAKILERKAQDQIAKESEKSDQFWNNHWKIHWQNEYSTPILTKADISEEKIDQDIRKATDEHDPMPKDLVGDALAAVDRYRGDEDEVEEQRHHPEPRATNVFVNNPPSNDVLAALLSERDESVPYLITREEFLENDPDYEQLQFTYWEGDQVLVMDSEEYNPIEDVDGVAGEDNLLHFGYGSGDEDVVYVRNPHRDPPMDLHITRSTGKYGVEVMGFDDDTPHLEHSQIRKFKLHDE